MSRAEISGLLARATLALDEQDKQGFADCFTEDVAIDIHFHDGRMLAIRGRAELLANSKGFNAEVNLVRHLVLTPDIRMDGLDAATARYQQLYVWIGENPRVGGAGDYTDTVRRVDGVWRIATRTHRFLTPPPR
jgi:hypothetical protein